MRINIYSEEVTGEVELVTKENVVGEDGNPTTFYGVRIYLKTHGDMHQTEHDDDRNAVTFWLRPGHDHIAGTLYGAWSATWEVINKE